MAYSAAFAVGEVVATTIQSRTRELADNVSTSNALLAKLSAKGNIKPAPGGDQIWQELQYAENDTFLWYEGADDIYAGTPASAVIDTAIYDWKQGAVTVHATGKEVNIQNTGKERMIDLLEGRISNAFKTMANQISVALYEAGPTYDAKALEGLQLQVADAPATGVVGTIDRATNVWWRNQVENPSTTIAATNIKAYMQSLWLKCLRGSDITDLIVGDILFYQMFWESLTDIQRITSTDKAVSGFQSLMFNSAPVVYDGDSGIAASHMYFLNTDYLFYRPHRDVNMVADSKRVTYEKDTFIVPILWAGNLTMSNAARQGVLIQGS